MPELTTHRQYPTTNRAVARARSDSIAFLASCGIDPADEFASDLVLVISELMTNAVTHARVPGTSGRQVGMSIEKADDVYRVEVRDAQGDDMPCLRERGLHDTRGRGLVLVEALADSWGVKPEAVGKTVWVEKRFGR